MKSFVGATVRARSQRAFLIHCNIKPAHRASGRNIFVAGWNLSHSRRFLSRFSGLRKAEPKQSTDFKEIASLRNARNDGYKITLNEYICVNAIKLREKLPAA
jgi:hypothetical protein